LCFDFATEEVHGGTGSDGGDIETLEVIDDILQGIKTFLDGKSVFVMYRSKELGDLSGC